MAATTDAILANELTGLSLPPIPSSLLDQDYADSQNFDFASFIDWPGSGTCLHDGPDATIANDEISPQTLQVDSPRAEWFNSLPHDIDGIESGNSQQDMAANSQIVPGAVPESGSPLKAISAARESKALTTRDEDWAPVKNRIIELHIQDNRPLREVKDIIEQEFASIGFRATMRQYRARLCQWRKFKHVKRKDMDAIVKRRQRRRVVDTHKPSLKFRLYGETIPSPRIEKWMKRNNVPPDQTYDLRQLSATPDALSVWTVSEHGSASSTPAINHKNRGENRMTSLAPSLSNLNKHTSTSLTGGRPRHNNIMADWTLAHVDGGAWIQHPARQRYLQDEEELAEQDLQACQRAHGHGHPRTLEALEQLGKVHIRQGRYSTAEDIFKSMLFQCEERYGRHHMTSLDALDALGRVLYHQGHFQKSEQLHREALNATLDLVGPKHLATLASMTNLVAVLEVQGRYSEAETLARQALSAKEETLGPRHARTLISLECLAGVLDCQGKYEASERMLLKALQVREETCGPAHRSTLRTRHSLASVLVSQERYTSAIEILERTLGDMRAIFGAEHPETLVSVSALARALFAEGRNRDAETLYREVYPIIRRIFGPDHPETFRIMYGYADVLHTRPDGLEQAFNLCDDARTGLERTLGMESPITKKCQFVFEQILLAWRSTR